MFYLRITCIIMIIAYICCLQFDPQKLVITYSNPKFLSFFKATLTKKDRRSPRMINVFLNNNIALGDNVMFSSNVHEYLSNRYQPTMIHWNDTFCKFLGRDKLGVNMMWDQVYHIVQCPLPPGSYNISYTLKPIEFPFELPFTSISNYVKTRLVISVYVVRTHETVATYYGDILLIRNATTPHMKKKQ